MKSLATRNMFGTLDLIGGHPKSRNGCISVYHVDCGNIAVIGMTLADSHWPSLEWLFAS